MGNYVPVWEPRKVLVQFNSDRYDRRFARRIGKIFGYELEEGEYGTMMLYLVPEDTEKEAVKLLNEQERFVEFAERFDSKFWERTSRLDVLVERLRDLGGEIPGISDRRYATELKGIIGALQAEMRKAFEEAE